MNHIPIRRHLRARHVRHLRRKIPHPRIIPARLEIILRHPHQRMLHLQRHIPRIRNLIRPLPLAIPRRRRILIHIRHLNQRIVRIKMHPGHMRLLLGQFPQHRLPRIIPAMHMQQALPQKQTPRINQIPRLILRHHHLTRQHRLRRVRLRRPRQRIPRLKVKSRRHLPHLNPVKNPAPPNHHLIPILPPHEPRLHHPINRLRKINELLLQLILLQMQQQLPLLHLQVKLKQAP